MAKLKELITGGRYLKILCAINRSIKGPYYFGAEPTYVDFYACGVFEMCEGKWLTPLTPYSGDTIAEHAPKLKVVLSNIRQLGLEKLPKVPQVPPAFVLSAERCATWGRSVCETRPAPPCRLSRVLGASLGFSPVDRLYVCFSGPWLFVMVTDGRLPDSPTNQRKVFVAWQDERHVQCSVVRDEG